MLLLLGTLARAEPTLRAPGDQTGPWRAFPGDDLRFADPDFDDSGWRAAPRTPWNLDPAFSGADVVWFRSSGSVRPLEGQELALSPMVWHGAWELYLDGALVGSGGGVFGESLGPVGFEVVAVPPERVPGDHHLDLALRVWCPSWAWAPGAQVGGVSQGDRPMLGLVVEHERLHTRARFWQMLAEGAFSSLVGLAHLALWSRRTALRAHLWFGFGALAFGAGGALVAAVWGGWVAPPPYFFGVPLLVQTAGFAAMIAFLGAFFGARGAWPVAAFVVGATVARVPLLVPYPTLDRVLLWSTLLVGLGWAGPVAWRGLRERVVGARAVAIGVAGFLLWPAAVGAEGLDLLARDSVLSVRALAELWLTGALVLGLAEQYAASLDDLEATLASARRFVPREVLERLGRARLRDVGRGDATRIEQTMLFFDIRGFSTLAEAHPPEATFALLNELFDRLEPCIRGHGGFVVQFTGDGFLGLFPEPDGAVAAAIEQVRALATFSAPILDGRPLGVGIGVHTGPMVLGTLGGPEQLLAGVVADAANVASRIEGLTKLYGARVLVSDVTAARLADPARFALREVDRVIVKGRREPIGVLEVLDAEPEPARRVRLASRFAEGWRAYRGGDFLTALDAFEACADDPAAAALAERCRALIVTPPASWDGVWRLATK